MRCGAWRLVALLAACSRVAAFDVEGGALGRPPLPRQGAGVASRGPQQQQQLGVRGIGGSVEAATAKISGWYRAYQSFVAAAAKVSQLISFCCGVWLVMSTPLTMLGAAFSVKITETAMVLLLGVYGLLMLGVEVPVGALQTMLRQYFFFVYTRPGRAAFVLNVALMAWSLTTVGFITKVLMTFNAILTFYILNSQDRRFAQVDAEAKAALQQAAEEMRGQASDALSFTKMFSGFGGFGGGGGSRSRTSAPVGGAGGAPGPAVSFDSRPDEPASSGQTGWPSGGGGGGA